MSEYILSFTGSEIDARLSSIDSLAEKTEITSAVSTHNSDTTAHSDIRAEIQQLSSEKANQSEVDALKTSVSEGKALIASAVTDKGVQTADDAAFAVMAANIRAIPGGSTAGVEYGQINPVVADYLENVNYNPNDYNVSNVATYANLATDYRKDHPATYPVTLENAGVLSVYDGVKAWSRDVEAGENSLYNSEPGKNCLWYLEANGDIKQMGAVKPTGACRMIYVTPTANPVKNVRDLGGWACDGGTVKYGKLFRGGALYANTSSLVVSMTDEDKAMFRDLLGIKHELDFRISSETTGQSGSTLGDTVEYTNIPIGAITSNYALMVDLDGSYADETKSILTAVINSVNEGKPIYFHCSYGADRTAVVAFVLNGILGVSQSDLDKDYELTSFSGESRPRTAAMYKGLIEYLKTVSTGSMRDCIVAWAVLLGIPIEDINAFRQNMIAGTPETVSPNINAACTGISLSANSGTVEGGTTITITAIPTPSWTTDEVVWSVADGNIATVQGNGKTAIITGIAGGTTTVTATCGNYSATFIVTVETALPAEYEAVDYIDHPDTANNIAQTAYCDLGITGRTGLIIKGKTMAYATADTYLVGSTDGTNRLLVGSSSSYIVSAFGPTMGGSCVYRVTNAECEFEFNTTPSGSYMKTNVPTASTPVHTEIISNTAAFDNGYNLALFCRNNKGTYQRIYSGRLYWLSIEENGAEIMHLLPCRRKSDSVVGLYDIIGNQFFTSLNASVPFVAGVEEDEGGDEDDVSYTNMVSTSIDSSGAVYNTTGYKQGYRLNSSGGESALEGAIVSGFIPITALSNVIRVYGLNKTAHSYAAGNNILLYNASFTKVGHNGCSGDSDADFNVAVDATTGTKRFEITPSAITDWNGTTSGAVYFRVSLSACSDPSKFIVTINEEVT